MISGALHVSGLLYMLISEPQLDKEGYEMQAKDGKHSFYKPRNHGVLKFTSTLKDGTYQLDKSDNESLCGSRCKAR